MNRDLVILSGVGRTDHLRHIAQHVRIGILIADRPPEATVALPPLNPMIIKDCAATGYVPIPDLYKKPQNEPFYRTLPKYQKRKRQA